MSLYHGSFLELLNNNIAAGVAVLAPDGTHVAGFDQSRPANSVLSSVAIAVGSVTLLAANPARRQFIVVNSTSKPVLLAFAATATAAVYTLSIANGATYVSPLDGYTGVISAIWPNAPSAGPVLHVTEVTT